MAPNRVSMDRRLQSNHWQQMLGKVRIIRLRHAQCFRSLQYDETYHLANAVLGSSDLRLWKLTKASDFKGTFSCRLPAARYQISDLRYEHA
jgi:hypothetical protein